MKYNDLAGAIKSPVYSRTDLALSGHEVLGYQLSLWVKKGYLIRLNGEAAGACRRFQKFLG